MLLVFGILPSPLATVNLKALLLECAKLLGLVVIMETTGHQSLDGVCNYKQTSVEQQQVVSDILSLAKKPRNECSEPTDVSPPVHSSEKKTK